MKKAGGSQDIAMVAKGNNKKKNLSNSDKECYNCKKKGHLLKDCWSKGEGKEGQGPGSKKKGKERQERTNQAVESINDSLNIMYMATVAEMDNSKIWVLDLGTSVHISNDRQTFVEYHMLKDSTIKGIGKEPVRAASRGMVIMKFNVKGKMFQHCMKDVLYVPEAENCLLSVSHFEEGGGTILFKDSRCFLRMKDNRLVGYRKRRG